MKTKLDKQRVSKIFAYLKDGKFLSQNSPNRHEKELFEYTQRYYDELYEYFTFIDIELKLGDGYCYFASYDNREKKLHAIYELIDIMSFFYNYSTMFGVGFKFTISEIEEKIKDDITLENRLKKIKGISGETRRSRIFSLVSKLEKRGFISLENEYMQGYLVLNSFEYLVKFFNKIEIKV